MKNQYYAGTPTSRRPVACPSTVKAGDPLLVGAEPCVAMNDYEAEWGGTVCHFDGSFILPVLGATQVSPLVGAALMPGDKVYADGTLDSATNVTHDITLSGATGDVLFGTIDPAYSDGVLSGVDDAAAVVRIGA